MKISNEFIIINIFIPFQQIKPFYTNYFIPILKIAKNMYDVVQFAETIDE